MRDIRRAGPGRSLRVLGRIAAGTVRVCLRYRVTGLAAEAGFFALLSFPPLILGLVAGLGFVGSWIGADVVAGLRDRLAELAATVLTEGVVQDVIMSTFDEVAQGGRLDILSLGFVISLWSGSRALNVYVDTISIMYGLGGQRGIVRTRALSFSLYVLTMVLGVIAFPLVLVGPTLINRFLDARWQGMPDLSWMSALYWPVSVVLSVALLATLYHVATPVRVPWRRELPGAVLALAIWLGASAVLRLVVVESVGGTSIYGPLSAPIIILIWLYLLAIAVLIGAAMNASLDEIWPDPGRDLARREGSGHQMERPLTPDQPKPARRERPDAEPDAEGSADRAAADLDVPVDVPVDAPVDGANGVRGRGVAIHSDHPAEGS